MPKVSGRAAEARCQDAGAAERFALLKIVRSPLEEEVLSMPLGEAATPEELTQLWEREWGVPHAGAIRFEAPAGSESRWLNPREDAVPPAPASIQLHCKGRGSVLTALASAFRRRGGASELVRRGDHWKAPTWSMGEVLRDAELRKREEASAAAEAPGSSGGAAAEAVGGRGGAEERLREAGEGAPAGERLGAEVERPGERPRPRPRWSSQAQEREREREQQQQQQQPPPQQQQPQPPTTPQPQQEQEQEQEQEQGREQWPGAGPEGTSAEEAPARAPVVRDLEAMSEDQRRRWEERQERQERNRKRREERERREKAGSNA